MTIQNSDIRRAFVTLTEGQLHLRRLDPAMPGDQTKIPLLMLHASPSSSWSLQGIMTALHGAGSRAPLIAPDTLGNGDSVAPSIEKPDIAYFADSMRRLLDALELPRVDVYGSHTGARIACEFAAAFPDRVRRVVLDGITEYDDDLRHDIIAHYAPTIAPDDYGRQFVWAFNFVRDQALHFPWFKRDPAHRLSVPVPPAPVLHRAALDVLKALDTYAKPYIAAFEYRAYTRMPAIRAPVLLLKPDSELPVLRAAVEKALSLLSDGRVATVVGGDASKAAAIHAFLESK
jgi:pimeloyl-ACP methyl ester carboxylesterase